MLGDASLISPLLLFLLYIPDDFQDYQQMFMRIHLQEDSDKL